MTISQKDFIIFCLLQVILATKTENHPSENFREPPKTSLASKKNPTSDAMHGQKLTRRRSDVMTMNGVSRRPRFFSQSKFSWEKVDQLENCGQLFLLSLLLSPRVNDSIGNLCCHRANATVEQQQSHLFPRHCRILTEDEQMPGAPKMLYIIISAVGW